MRHRQLNVVRIKAVKDTPIFSEKKVARPEDAVALLADVSSEFDREIMMILNLQSDNTPIAVNFCSMGTLTDCITEMREIFKSAVLMNSAQIMLLHNHPSNNVIPSTADIKFTERVIEAGNIMGIPLLDSIVLGNDGKSYYSMRANGACKFFGQETVQTERQSKSR